MKRRAIVLLCAVLASCTASGCGTMFNLGFTPCGINHDAGRIYGGVRGDVEMAANGRQSVARLTAAAVDLPLSLVGDTVTLPIILPVALAKNLKRKGSGAERPPARESVLGEGKSSPGASGSRVSETAAEASGNGESPASGRPVE